MHFKLFTIDKIELVLMWENMPVARLCHIKYFGTGRCTKSMK